ncbi:MAG TPA: DNA cytosine methyltransferase, partial [Allocoleopsis sp.]
MSRLNTEKRAIAIDLFAGVGGMTLGFEMAGFDVLGAVEIDPIHCATHHYNFPHFQVICADISNITGAELRSKLKLENQEIDVIFGGPPCQGFSMIGKRALDDDRNQLMADFVRLVSELQPKYFVIENVKGMTLGKHQGFIQEIIEKFNFYDYKVLQPYQVLNAANFGVPQNRERLFLLGAKKGLALPNYPEKLTIPCQHNKILKNPQNLLLSPNVFEAIADLPEVNNYDELRHQDWVKTTLGKPSDYAKILIGIKVLDDDYSYKRQYDQTILTGCLRTEHNPESRERFLNTSPGETEPISRFYKLHPHGICNTLRAGTPSNKGAHTSPRPIHYKTPRCITVREAARLHSYPDWFRFHVTKWHGFRQI